MSMENIQSFIANISAPKTPEQLMWHMRNYGGYVIERVLDDPDGPGDWTVPRWAKHGDIVFFMHAVSAVQYLKSIRRKICELRDSYRPQEFDEAMSFIQHGLVLHSLYGGKIFAVSRVLGAPKYFSEDEPYYWHSHIYADMGDTVFLTSPVPASEFKSFLPVARQTSITPVIGSNFDRLRELIISHGNTVPNYLTDASASPFPLSAINGSNWLELCNEYRNRFFLEEQFRKYYADYLLRALSDDGRLYAECRVRKNGEPDSFVDNVILLHGAYISVEVKLNASAEPHLPSQLGKYCNADVILRSHKVKSFFPTEDIRTGEIIVLDTENLGLYTYHDKTLRSIYKLSSLKTYRDITALKRIISHAISEKT